MTVKPKPSKSALRRKAAIRELRRQAIRVVGKPCKTWCPGCVSCELWWAIARLDPKFPDDERKPCPNHLNR